MTPPDPTVADLPAPSDAPQNGEVDAELRRTKRRQASRNWTAFILFAGPNILLILGFIYYPLFSNVYYSTLDWRLGAPSADPVGISNYIEFLTSDDGLEVWRITAIFTVATVVGSMVIGLLLALVINLRIPGRVVARTGLFSPYVLSGVGVGLVWLFIFDPAFGVLGQVFRFFGQNSPEWFLDPDLALAMVIIVYVWKNVGYCAVVYLAGLQSIPKDLLEAAAIDKAGAIRRFFTVTLPLLSPTIFFLSVTTLLSTMQAFDLLLIMTPTGNGTNTIIFEVYLQSFGAYQRAGYSAAIAVVLFLALFVITAIQMRFVERKVHYA